MDESYDKSRYWIAGLICPEREAVPLTKSLDDVVKDAAKKYSEISERAELHGHSLFHGKDDWEPLVTMPRARIGVYNAAFQAIASHPVEIVIRGVDIKRLERRYVYPDHPHSVVLSHLLERIDERAEAHDELVLAIADEVHGADEYRRNLWHFQRFATTGYRARQLTRIVDTIHFAPSSASRLVQAVDLIAFLWFRRQSGAERDARAVRANEALWARVKDRIHQTQCWFP